MQHASKHVERPGVGRKKSNSSTYTSTKSILSGVCNLNKVLKGVLTSHGTIRCNSRNHNSGWLSQPRGHDVESLFPLFGRRQPQDFLEPRLEAPQAEQALPPPDFPQSWIHQFPKDEVSPQSIADGADGMDVDAGEVGEGSEPNDYRQGRWGFRRGRIWEGRRECVVEQPYSSNISWCVEHFLFWKSLVVLSLLVAKFSESLRDSQGGFWKLTVLAVRWTAAIDN